MGALRLVATPIGNLEDISLRALRILKESDLILCEDTRTTKRLLDHYEIKIPTMSYHQHSGEMKIGKIISLLREGKNLALTSDAGTPGISDPGGKLVSVLRQEMGDQVVIESLPGASALAVAASLAGEGFDRFTFLGFLPHKKGRQTMLKEIVQGRYPVILYESKHRILKLLTELEALEQGFQISLQVAVFRELTKAFESAYFGRPKELLNRLSAEPQATKGEFAVAIRRV